MKASTSVVLVALIALGGQWAEGKKFEMRTVVGLGVLAVSLSILVELDSQLADQFGVLIFLGACFIYLPRLVKGLGL